MASVAAFQPSATTGELTMEEACCRLRLCQIRGNLVAAQLCSQVGRPVVGQRDAKDATQIPPRLAHEMRSQLVETVATRPSAEP